MKSFKIYCFSFPKIAGRSFLKSLFGGGLVEEFDRHFLFDIGFFENFCKLIERDVAVLKKMRLFRSIILVKVKMIYLMLREILLSVL